MKNIKLFENFDSYPKDLADQALEGMMDDAFPDYTEAVTGSAKPGEYVMDEDTHGDGTPFSFVEIYFTSEEYKAIEQQIDEDYEAYLATLQEFITSHTITDIGTAPDYNMISVSVDQE